MVKYLFR